MARTAETDAREATLAELKRLITAGTYETLEKLEDAVDSFLWSEQDRMHADDDRATDSPRAAEGLRAETQREGARGREATRTGSARETARGITNREIARLYPR